MMRWPGWLLRAVNLPILIAALGVVLSVGVACLLHLDGRRDAEREFARLSERARFEVARRFAAPLQGLRGTLGTYHASRSVDRAAFRAAVEAQNLTVEYPGVRGFGFIVRVDKEHEPTYLAGVRADGAPWFAIRELAAGAHDDRFVIQYIEPLSANLPALGLDVGSEPRRRAAIERAVRTGQPTLTEPVVLVQDGRKSPGFLMFLPVYRNGTDPATPAQRQAALVGVIYAPIVAAELLEGSTAALGHQLQFTLQALDANGTPTTVVYDSALSITSSASAPSSASPLSAHVAARGAARDAHRAASTIEIAGNRLAMSVRATAAFETTIDRASPVLAAGTGLLLTGLLVGLAMHGARARAAAEARAAGLTVQLDRLATVARCTNDAVLLLDAERCIQWVNDGFVRNTGFALEEAIGRRPSELLRSQCETPGGLQALFDTLARGEPFRGELCNRRKDGQPYWLDLELQPQHDADGAVTGWVAIESDITERRRTAIALAEALRDNEALLGTIRTHAIVSVAGPDGRIVDVNDAFCAISGYTRDELVGQDHRIVNSGHHPRAFWVEMWCTIAAGKPWRGQVCNRAKDGSLYWVDSIVAPFVGADGRIEKYVSVRSDISASQRAHDELARERERLALIVEGTGAGTWETDFVSGDNANNAAYAAMLGDDCASLAARNGGNFLTLVHPGDRAQVQRARDEHFAGRTATYETEFRIRHRDGRWIWVHSRGRVGQRDASGRPLRMAGIHLDISARRAMQEALRRQSEVMTSIVENLPSGVSVFDEQRRLVASNRRFRELLDLPDALFEGPEPPTFEALVRFNAARGEYGVGDVESVVAERLRFLEDRTGPHRFERVRPDGTAIEALGAPMPGGGLVTIYNDLTERRRAEREIERQAALLRGAIDAVDEAFVVYDPDDRLVWCNERYRQIYHRVAELIRPGVRFEELVRAGAERGEYADAVGRVDEWVRERMALHRHADRDTTQRLGDGRMLRIVERRLPDGHTVGFRIDITQLTQATEAAQEASRAKSQFLANMSHEIRTPMNAVLGMLKLLGRTALNRRQEDYVDKAEGAARSLLTLLNDILDFSKVEAGRMELEAQPFRLDALLRDVSVILSANAAGRAIELRLELDPALPPVLVGDATRLRQVLVNLGGNAIKFTPQGEVALQVALHAREDDQATIRFAVRDTGIGIAPENHARIFSGFTQAEASTTRRFGGTGLGLAISQRLIALMGGELGVHSALGEGATFSFTITLPVAADGHGSEAQISRGEGHAPALPMHEADRSDSARAGASMATRGRLAGLRLLVAEDNATNQQVARELLADEGATVEIAGDGLAAVTAVASAAVPFDAVLMDLQMPLMDGYAATSRIRHDLGQQALPIIAMTANAMPSDRAACLAAGMNDHVAKPFDLDHLVAVLQRAAGRVGPGAPVPAAGDAPDADGAAVDGLNGEVDAGPTGIDLQSALARLGGRRDVYRRLLDGLLGELARGLATWRASADDGDIDELRREAHSLKGLAGTLGAHTLADAAAQAERDWSAGNVAGSDDPTLACLVEQAKRAQAVLGALRDRLDDHLPAPEAGAAAEPLDAMLRVLQSRLDEADMDALAVLDRLRAGHADRLGERLAPLDDAVARLDFEEALALCRELQETCRP